MLSFNLPRLLKLKREDNANVIISLPPEKIKEPAALIKNESKK